MSKNNAKIIDVHTLIAAGIDPKTGLPIKLAKMGSFLQSGIYKAFKILDEQNAINRYKWYNLPNGLDGNLLERILYYRGQLMFFFSPIDDKFYILPFALNSTIDIYGRFVSVQGLPFNGINEEKGIEAFTRKVIWNDQDIDESTFDDGCVLLTDYSKAISQTIIPRELIQDPILKAMSEAMPFARTSLISNSGIRGFRVQNEADAASVKEASKGIYEAALNGDPFAPMVAEIEFQDLTSAGSALKSEEYLIYLQALDNLRLSLYGLKTGGLFQKKSHMLEEEQQMNEANTLLAYQDGLSLRQRFCDFVNSIWGLGIWVEPSECVTGTDDNMDGLLFDEQDQSGEPGEQDITMTGGEEDEN